MNIKNIRTFLILLGIIGIITLFYGNHFHNAFHFDDSHVIVDNPYVKNLDKAPQFFRDASTFSSLPQNQTYRPLLTMMFAIDYKLAKGLNPYWFHLDSFFWFILTVISVFLITNHFFKASSFGKQAIQTLPFVAAAWFGLHTANAETVNYISARSDIFSGFAVVSSMVLWIYLPKLRKFGLYLIPFIAGIFAKEQTIMFLPIFATYYWLFVQKKSFADLFSFKQLPAIKTLIAKSAVVIIIAIIGAILVIKMASSSFTPGGTNRGLYILTQTWVICRYLVAFLIPANLSADSDWTIIHNVFDERIILGVLVVTLLIIMAFKLSKTEKNRPIAFGIAWFFMALLPTSLVPLAEVTNDHRMFFPFIGLTIALIWTVGILLEQFSQKRAVVTLIILLIPTYLLANGIGVYQRNKVWKTEESLWLDVTQKSPMNGRGLMNYGLTQMRMGNLERADAYYQRALLFTPQYPILYINIGICKNAMGNPQEAEYSFKKAIEFGSSLYEPYYYYSDFLFKNNRKGEAKDLVEKSLAINPWYMNSRYLAMSIYNDTENWQKLEEITSETLQKFPSDSTATKFKIASQKKESKIDTYKRVALEKSSPEIYLSLSLELYNKGDFHGCIEACNKALELKPDYAEAYNNICSAYNALGMYDKAIQAGEQALKINPNYILAKNNLNYAKSMKK
jgi:tetratricopeptide (TPR) repeat protein